jgi:5-methylcytosine-specific restriction endonuclease McrA
MENVDKLQKYYQDNKEALNKKNREYHYAHRKENAEENRKRAKDWYWANPENREKAKKRSREYEKNNKERSRLQHLDWQRRNRKRHLSVRTAAQARRRAKQLNAGGEYTPEQFTHICEYYGGMCLVCGRKIKLAADHVMPITKGGHSYISNIQPLCKNCNSKKRDKHEDHRPAGWGNAFPGRLLTA